MSRHEVPAKDPAHRVVVGWDHPLSTFFAIVYDRAKEGTDDEIVAWRGHAPRELYEVENLQSAVRKYAELTPDMLGTLYGDKDEGR